MTPYATALQKLRDAELDLGSGTFQILYVGSGYTADLTDSGDSTEDDLGANIVHRETLSGVTWSNRVFDASDLTIADPGSGTATQIVIVKGSGASAANDLICHQTLGESITFDGTNDSQTFNASGIFRIGSA